MDMMNLDNYGNYVFTVDTKIRDISTWNIVEGIGYEQIYLYLKARGYTNTTFHITDHPGVLSISVYARFHEGETLVKELAEIYPNYIFSAEEESV